MSALFVSHASVDKAFVDEFDDTILRGGCGLKREDIFYSSGSDTGLTSGSDLMHEIRRKAGSAKLMLSVISPTYQSRPVCVAELGAGWATTGNLFPMLVPGLPRDSLAGVLGGLTVRYMDDPAMLDELHDAIAEIVTRRTTTSTWNRYREKWLNTVGDLAKNVPGVTPQAIAGSTEQDPGIILPAPYSELAQRLPSIGLTNFFANRMEYGRFRPPGTIAHFLSSADARIDIAAYWMAQGNESESVARKIVRMLDSKPGLTARIAMIDPDGPYLELIAEYMDMQVVELKSRLRWSLDSLIRERKTASESARQRLSVLVYQQMPSASVIMLDYGKEVGARMQLDFKPFHRPRSDSFSIELSSPSSLYNTCSDAWMELIDSSKPYTPIIELASPD